MEENDLQYTMKREEFEKIIQPVLQSVTEVFTKLKNTIQSKNINLHSI
jgi:hypothetical protein